MKTSNSIIITAIAVIGIIAVLAALGWNPQQAINTTVSAQYDTFANAVDAKGTSAKQTELTIYAAQNTYYYGPSQTVTLVKETRSYEHTGGASRVSFQQFPSMLIQDSFTFKDLTDLSSVISEKTFTPAPNSLTELAKRYEGKQITAISANSTTTGKLISSDYGLLLETPNGVTLVNSYDKLLFADKTGLTSGFEAVINSQRNGNHDVALTYQTQGLSWKANYNAVLKGDDLVLDSEAVITNQAGANFENAKVNLVAANVNLATQPRAVPMYSAGAMAKDSMMESVASSLPAEQAVGETHTYALPNPVTLNNGQVKTTPLLPQTTIKAAQEFTFEPNQGDAVNVKVTFTNSKENKLGAPLPAGTFNVYSQAQDGTTVLAGQDSIQNTPEGQNVTLIVAKSFDVTAKREVLNTDSTKCAYITKYKTTLSNAKDKNVNVKVKETNYGTVKITSQMTPVQPDQNTYEWNINVPAKSTSTLEYTITNNWC